MYPWNQTKTNQNQNQNNKTPHENTIIFSNIFHKTLGNYIESQDIH